ncbi:hypothetical protein ACFLX5_03290 [Chloroflexota bacterium]
MGKQYISERHKPSITTYLRQNFKTTFAITEKAELMAALCFILISAALATIGGFSASSISDRLDSLSIQIAVGITVFVGVQFGVLTPFRMWRKSVWVVNIENLLGELWDSHEEGINLIHAHIDFLYKNPGVESKPKCVADWVDNWKTKADVWAKETQAKLLRLHPIEERRFKNIYAYQIVFGEDNLNPIHSKYRNILVYRLQMLTDTIDRHQPRLLPE